jgi:hypothetical protein
VKRWLRRNAVALVGIAVLTPATIAVTFSTEWNTFLTTRATQPVEVAAGLSAEFDGAEWRVARTERISSASSEGVDAGLPSGSDLVLVTVEVDPEELAVGDESSFCTVRLGEYEGSGNTPLRSWGDATYAAIDYRNPDGVESGCSPDVIEPYKFISTFVIADDASDNLGVLLEVPDQLPRYLLLRL